MEGWTSFAIRCKSSAFDWRYQSLELTFTVHSPANRRRLAAASVVRRGFREL